MINFYSNIWYFIFCLLFSFHVGWIGCLNLTFILLCKCCFEIFHIYMIFKKKSTSDIRKIDATSVKMENSGSLHCKKLIAQYWVKRGKLCNQSKNLLEMEWNLLEMEWNLLKVIQLLYNWGTLSLSSLISSKILLFTELSPSLLDIFCSVMTCLYLNRSNFPFQSSIQLSDRLTMLLTVRQCVLVISFVDPQDSFDWTLMHLAPI